MAYTKNTWTQNDLITADKLNNIEEGISDTSVFYLTLPAEAISSSEEYTKNLTEEEINSFKKWYCKSHCKSC